MLTNGSIDIDFGKIIALKTSPSLKGNTLFIAMEAIKGETHPQKAILLDPSLNSIDHLDILSTYARAKLKVHGTKYTRLNPEIAILKSASRSCSTK